MTASTAFFISSADQREILRLLRTIPELVEELAISTSRQDRMSTGGLQISSNSHREKPLPFNNFASDVSADLHGVLVGWVRHVLEQRAMVWEGSDSILTLARWLDRNVVALAMTEGAEDFLDELQDALKRAWRAIDRAPERETVVGDEQRAEVQDRMQELRVSPAQAESLVESLGYPPLRAATIRQWAKRGRITKGQDGTYRFGDILDLNPLRGLHKII